MRKGDILELTQYFLARHEGRGRLTMTPAAVDALIAYDWPGNVRELERMIEGAIATAESRQIRVDDLPVSLRGGYGEHLVPSCQLGDTMRAWGSRYARLVLEKNAGNKRQACRALDISYHTLNSYLRYRPATRAASPGIRASWCRRRAESTGCRKPPALEEGEAGRKCRAVMRLLRRLGDRYAADISTSIRDRITRRLADARVLELGGAGRIRAASGIARQGGPVLVDPVLDQTITTLRELVAEGDAKPASRKASARAIEATLGIQAAHIGLHYDAQLQRGLRRRQARVGRAA